MSDESLLFLAREMRKRSHAPYSRFHVGAALRGASGKIYGGCNIENSSYPVGICAEHTALAVAVASGERNFTEIAIAGPEEKPIAPCGKCRQALAEFAPKLRVLLVTKAEPVELTLDKLLPAHFDGEILLSREEP